MQMAALSSFTAVKTAAGLNALDVKLDVGRTLGLMVLGLAALAGSIVLYALNKTTGATAVLAVAQAILFGGFGIEIGARAGARAAETELNA
jgi:hypothetical protein